jgi:putative oxidoreductase
MSAYLLKITRFYFQVVDFLQPVFLLIIRAYFGYRFLMTGLGKFQNFDRTVGFFSSLGLPMPEVSAALAAGTELVGGLLLILGLFTKLAALPLTFTMLVAYFTAHQKSLQVFFLGAKFDGNACSVNFFAQSPFPFLFTCLVLMFFGAGKFSLDRLLSNSKRANSLIDI